MSLRHVDDYIEKNLGYCTLGFDLKLNRANQPFVIEINGVDSGIAGLREITGRDLIRERRECRERTYEVMTGRPISDNSARTQIRNYFMCEPRKLIEMTGQIPQLGGVTCDKSQTKKFIPQRFLAPYCEWDGCRETIENFISSLYLSHSSLLDLEKYPLLVAKGNFGSHGKNVRVISIKDVDAIVEFLGQFAPGQAMLEGFVESKKINTHYEDGCMRYLNDFVVNFKTQQWRTSFTGAYWRVRAGDRPDLDPDIRFKLNYTGKNRAHTAAASHDDLATAKSAVDQTIDYMLKELKVWKSA